MTLIAVTEATGFVGSRLVKALLDEGYAVRGLSRTAVDNSPAGRATMIRGDMRDPQVAREAITGADAVVHLPAGFSPDVEAEDSIVTGTHHVLEAAAEAGVRRVIGLSCLGVSASSEQSYFAAMWQGEAQIRASGIPYVILRHSLVLGRDDGVTRPMADLLRAWPVFPLPGRGEERMQPIDVDDLVRCILVALGDEARTDEIISVGGPVFLTLRQLVDLVGAHVGVSRAKLLLPGRAGAQASRLLPAPWRELFTPARVAQLRQDVVASPGIVDRAFGFQPSSVLSRLPEYLA